MPDISMCANLTCPLGPQCYRNPASGTVPSQRQSWMVFTYRAGPAGAECDDFLLKFGKSLVRPIVSIRQEPKP